MAVVVQSQSPVKCSNDFFNKQESGDLAGHSIQCMTFHSLLLHLINGIPYFFSKFLLLLCVDSCATMHMTALWSQFLP